MRTLFAGAAVGTMLLASVAAAAPGASDPRILGTRGPVRPLAADGDRVGIVIGRHRRAGKTRWGGCATVVVWEPMRRRLVRLQTLDPCERGPTTREGTHAVAVAGTRAAWLRTTGGNTLETWLKTATLARPSPVDVAMTAAVGDSGYGAYIRRPVGDGRLIAFTSEERCDAYNEGADQCPPGRKHGEIVGATVWQVGDRPCRGTVATRPRGCSKVAKADSELTVLAVDAGRIAIRTENGISLLARTGRVLREFDVAARAAALSGERLAMRTASAIELYDTASGRLVDHLAAPVGLRLEDLDGDILVTASAGTVTLRRFADGRTSTIRAGGIARAQLERPGLFIASGCRVTFTPMRDILRRLRG